MTKEGIELCIADKRARDKMQSLLTEELKEVANIDVSFLRGIDTCMGAVELDAKTIRLIKQVQ